MPTLMIPEMARPLATLDVGSIELDRIVQIAVMKFMPDGERARLVLRVNPGIPISPTAIALHHISDKDIEKCPPFGAIARHLADVLDDCDLCGFNIKQFDLPFLMAEFSRAGIKFLLRKRAVLDVTQFDHSHEDRGGMILATSAVLVALMTKHFEKT